MKGGGGLFCSSKGGSGFPCVFKTAGEVEDGEVSQFGGAEPCEPLLDVPTEECFLNRTFSEPDLPTLLG